MNRIAYFDNAATTFPKPEVVYSFMDKFYRECGTNVGRGQHKLASQAGFLVSETRELLLSLNHCPSKRVVFTSTATEALNIILRGIRLSNGSNVYISPFEHNAVIRILHYLSQSVSLNIITLAFNEEDYTYDPEKIGYQFSEQSPSLVVISHASNVCGIIAPIIEIASLAKRYRAINVIDMCQTMGLIDTDISVSCIDFAVFSGHKKLYGPFGIAGFICSADVELEPFLYGGTGFDSASKVLPATIPEKFEVGSPNIMSIAGLNASLKWLLSVGIAKIFEVERHNLNFLIEILKKYNNIKTVSLKNVDNMVGIISCFFEGYSSDNIGQILSNLDVAVRSGLHCAPDAHKYLKTFPSGTVRFSVSYFNDENDFIKLKNALSYIRDNT
ncbi:MAG: aminotransferase class V-fold PLP-dependent enzyme [Candidatus Cloacimonetes bacterium]|nr:aminotransferase class V-fold PLP-dependent enzyme [Candidatus Cloacimonadota bacterium]